MSYQPKMQLPPPDNWTAFEDLCWGLWKFIWRDDSAQKNGRNGQSQHGVDVFGRPNKGQYWAGVQCKGKDTYTDQELTEAEIESERNKAQGFTPRLSEYAIATTASRDASLQRIVRDISDRSMHEGLFSVTVYSWHDIVDLLYEHTPPIASQFYPQIFGGELIAVARQVLRLITHRTENSVSVADKISIHRNDDSAPLTNRQTSPNITVAITDLPTIDASSEDSPVDVRFAVDFMYSIQQQQVFQKRANSIVSSDATLVQAVNILSNTLQERELQPSEGSDEC